MGCFCIVPQSALSRGVGPQCAGNGAFHRHIHCDLLAKVRDKLLYPRQSTELQNGGYCRDCAVLGMGLGVHTASEARLAGFLCFAPSSSPSVSMLTGIHTPALYTMVSGVLWPHGFQLEYALS